MNNRIRALTLVFFLALLIVFAGVGCGPEPDIIEDIVEDELNGLPEDGNDLPDPGEPDPVEPEDPVKEPAGTPDTYYWPWLSHGHLDLSTGEVIAGPDLFESDLGFISEFTEGDSYEGRLVWITRESDLFALQWVTLSFNVDYFEESDWVANLAFVLEITDLQPEPGDKGIQEFALDINDQQHDFEVAVTGISLGKSQEGSIGTEPIDYIALEVKMRVLGNP